MASCGIALAAVALAFVAIREVRSAHGNPRWDTALQVVWQLEAEWNSDAMADARARAAGALLDHRNDDAVEEVLRFLDEVGYMSERVGLDHELLWYRFYWPAACYWKASDFLRRRHPEAATRRYRYLPALVEALQAQENRRAQDRTAPTAEEVRDFLLAEARTGACEEEPSEDSAQMTPL